MLWVSEIREGEKSRQDYAVRPSLLNRCRPTGRGTRRGVAWQNGQCGQRQREGLVSGSKGSAPAGAGVSVGRREKRGCADSCSHTEGLVRCQRAWGLEEEVCPRDRRN